MSAKTIQDLRILMVAPSKVLAAVLRKELGEMGAVQTVSCKNIAEALEKMHEVKPDLVVSSMYFEDGDGIDLITAMRNDEVLAKTLFMLISSETRFEMLDPVRQAGVVAILSRPFTQQALTQAFETTLGHLEHKPVSIDHQKLSTMKILLVDDSRLARRHMQDVLERMGITPLQVTQAENGHEAIARLTAEKFDLVLTDYNMPSMDGEELLKCIRQNPELDRIPVFMVTSEENEAKLASIKSNGVTALFNKPFDAPNLKGMLERHMQNLSLPA